MTDPVLAFVDAAAADPQVALHSLVVRNPGGILAEAYWDPYRADDRQLVYSVSKTVMATAAGFALAEGLVHLDDRVVDLIGAPVPVDGRRRELTFHHLLSMTTGHDADTLDFAADIRTGIASSFWGIEPQTPVGSRHVYSNGASWAVGEVVRTVAGTSLVDYLRPRLLDPLGIDLTWDTDARGSEYGFTGAHLTTRALAAIGQVYASGGRWQGRQVLPSGWAELASTHHTRTEEPNPEWNFGYGYQVWLGREGFRLDGAYGQYALVLPESETVIAITSAQAVTSQPVLDLVWEHLVPHLADAPAPERDDRLAGLSLRVPKDSGRQGTWAHEGPVPLRPALAVGAEQLHLPDIADLRVTRDAEGFEVTFRLEGEPVTLTTAGPWRRQPLRTGGTDVPVALAAAVSSRGAARVRLCITDTPHVLSIEVDDSGAGLAWQTSPLHMASFGDLAAH
ncbi:MAG TPA: serine hydrolase [Propionibacteriaceae bacterium]|nr:serine hydrolase [Propionibacteriaceae bacterium]